MAILLCGFLITLLLPLLKLADGVASPGPAHLGHATNMAFGWLFALPWLLLVLLGTATWAAVLMRSNRALWRARIFSALELPVAPVGTVLGCLSLVLLPQRFD